MDSKIQELTDKIYREGVEKGNEEARQLVDQAKAEAERIIADAKKEADAIIVAAQKNSKENEERTKSELKLFASQAVNALKTEAANLITDKIVTESVGSFTNDSEAIGAFLVKLAEKWSSTEPIVISTAEAEPLKKYFVTKAKQLLDKGVTIQQVNGQKALFTISPADGSYKIDFGEEEFENYFKSFLRPQLVELLF